MGGRTGILRALLSGGIWVFGVQSLARLSALVTTFVAARALGVDEFGTFVALQAVMLTSVAVWDFGLTPLTTREVAAADDGQWRVLLGRAIRARLWTLPIWAAAFIVGVVLIGGAAEGELALAALILAAAALANGGALLGNAVLEGRMRFRIAALALASGRIVGAAGAILVWLLGVEPAAPALALALFTGEYASLVGIGVVLRTEGSRSVVAATVPPTESTFTLLRRAVPLACNGFFNLIYNRLDVAIVLLLAGSVEAGLYAPASRIQDGLYLLPASAVAALLPLASRRFASGEGDVRRMLLVSTGLSLGVTLPAVLVVVLLAQPVVELLLGAEYAGAVAPVRILALSVPFIALSTPLVSTLMATDRASATTAMFGTGLVVSLVGLLLLAPSGGAIGAAWASMAREPAIALVGAWLALRRRSEPGLRPAPAAAGVP